MSAVTANTMAVSRRDSCLVGQVTLRSSPRVSRKYRNRAFCPPDLLVDFVRATFVLPLSNSLVVWWLYT